MEEQELQLTTDAKRESNCEVYCCLALFGEGSILQMNPASSLESNIRLCMSVYCVGDDTVFLVVGWGGTVTEADSGVLDVARQTDSLSSLTFLAAM